MNKFEYRLLPPIGRPALEGEINKHAIEGFEIDQILQEKETTFGPVYLVIMRRALGATTTRGMLAAMK